MWWTKKKNKSIEQFGIDSIAFNATGLKKESILDVKINENIKEKVKILKAEEEAERKSQHDKNLYILDCVNVNICPVCGEELKEILCPESPGCWEILEICTKCNWQLVLSDLDINPDLGT